MNLLASIFIGILLLMCIYLFWLWFCFGNCVKRRQKTRSPQQRRMYVGSRARPSLAQQEPSIFVSPSNLPPPPKYECMAPPSYDEVVGVHYPNYQVQPITTPITAALAAHTSTDNPETRTETTTETRSNDTSTVTRTADETIVNVPRVVTASS